MKIMNYFMFIVCMVVAPAFGQGHFPTAVVEGDTVVIDADIVWFDNYPEEKPYELVQGEVLMHDSILASRNGSDPIILKVKPGSYSITALGFPEDRMNPERNKEILSVVVNSPSRQELITAAYSDVLKTRDTYLNALRDLAALNPTRKELIMASP